MLTFRLLERTSEYSIYEYYPDGNKQPGKVIFYSDGRKDILELSEVESEEFCRYAIHALNDIPDLGKDSGTIAWC